MTNLNMLYTRNLKQVVNHGSDLKTVHRVIKFDHNA